MDQSTLIELRRARDLLQTGKNEEARLILAQLIKQDPSLDHAWYLLSFAVTDPQKQRYALEQVLHINPDYEKARKRLASLGVTGELPLSAQSKDSTARPEPVKETSQLEVGPSSQEPGARGRKQRISPLMLVLALSGLCAILILVLGAAFLLVDGSFLASLLPASRPPLAQDGINPSPDIPPTVTYTPQPTLTPTWTPTPTSETVKPAFISTTCEFRPPQGARVDCGYVMVPEKRDGSPTHTIRLAVALYHSASDAPASEPVIYLHGGPGGEAVQTLALVYDSFLVPLLKERDVIVFDQRGTGLSSPSLACPEMDSAPLPQEATQADQISLIISAFEECHNRLAYTEIDLDAYTSAASAADVGDILAALGYQQADLYGVSYGTRLALTVMRDKPEIVRSAVLDSSLPLEIKLYNELAAKTDYAFNALFAGCAADSGCNQAYPDLKDKFYEMLERFNAQPVSVRVKDLTTGQYYEIKMDGNDFVSTLNLALYSSELIPILPQTIYNAYNNDFSLLSSLLSLSTPVFRSINLGVFTLINCHEQVYATTPEQLDADLSAFPKLNVFAQAAVYGSPQTLFSICDLWGAVPHDPVESQPVQSAVPSLILAGEYDPATPPFFARQLLNNLSASYYVEFPGSGHAVSMDSQEACPLDIVLAFLSNPDQQPDVSCIVDMQRPNFITTPINSAP